MNISRPLCIPLSAQRGIAACGLALVLGPLSALAEAPAAPAAATELRSLEGGDRLVVIESLRREAHDAVQRGVRWLLAQQQEGGHWSNPQHPALTGLPVWALVLAGERESEAVRRAALYMRAHARENGAIFLPPGEDKKVGGLSSYNTAISMIALHMVGDPADIPLIQRARAFMARLQHLGGDVYRGGFGYDALTDRNFADLSNSYIAFEAMRMTESVEDFRQAGEARVDLDWDAALQFIHRTHNNPDVNPQPWATRDPEEYGGFVYHPKQTRAGTITGTDGMVRFRSMPGMTYAGLLSYIYADVDRNDPRVEATVNWAVRHWNLDASNRPVPGATERHETRVEREGLYFKYNVMTKGLAAFDRDVFRPDGRPPFNWRVEMLEKLLSLQKIDPQTGAGYWVNEVGRYWESDPVLVTSYVLIALQVALEP